ncbi:MAG: hypothetical protein AB1721_01215, partial [Patescibacteria group bacterium]
ALQGGGHKMKKIITLLFLIALATSACGAGAPQAEVPPFKFQVGLEGPTPPVLEAGAFPPPNQVGAEQLPLVLKELEYRIGLLPGGQGQALLKAGREFHNKILAPAAGRSLPAVTAAQALKAKYAFLLGLLKEIASAEFVLPAVIPIYVCPSGIIVPPGQNCPIYY